MDHIRYLGRFAPRSQHTRPGNPPSLPPGNSPDTKTRENPLSASIVLELTVSHHHIKTSLGKTSASRAKGAINHSPLTSSLFRQTHAHRKTDLPPGARVTSRRSLTSLNRGPLKHSRPVQRQHPPPPPPVLLHTARPLEKHRTRSNMPFFLVLFPASLLRSFRQKGHAFPPLRPFPTKQKKVAALCPPPPIPLDVCSSDPPPLSPPSTILAKTAETILGLV